MLCVFGCGGNRDRAKRPLMGAAAAQLSDLAFVTSDNPRDEDPLAIIEEVLAGIPGGRANPQVVVEPDRGVAIRLALDAARPGDVVVIAGKGHETYQEIGGQRLPFDDAVEARRALSAALRLGPADLGRRRRGSDAPVAPPCRRPDAPCSACSSREASLCGSPSSSPPS